MDHTGDLVLCCHDGSFIEPTPVCAVQTEIILIGCRTFTELDNETRGDHLLEGRRVVQVVVY